MTDREPETIDLDAKMVDELRQRLAAKKLRQDDYKILRAVLDSQIYLADLLKQKNISIARLRQLVFGARTEKTDTVLGASTDSSSSSADENKSTEATDETPSDETPSDEPPADEPPSDETPSDEPPADETPSDEAAPRPRTGHGRNGANAYTGAEKIAVPHDSLQAGDVCPNCEEGTLYPLPPGVRIRFTGQAPVQATIYQLEKLRCNLCGKLFTAAAPEGVSAARDYDVTVGSAIAVLKYGYGFPFHRLQSLQENVGIPLPASTQWGIIAPIKEMFRPVLEELIRQAACGELVHNDDTPNRILEKMGHRAMLRDPPQDGLAGPLSTNGSERRGIYTSGIISVYQGHRIALFFTGNKHAGENLAKVLSQRAEELGPPMQMCDASSHNVPGELETILGNCLAHGRRRFVEVVDLFPPQCRYVLEAFRVIYTNDAIARERKLSPQQRLEFHQRQSGPTMDKLHAWLTQQFEDRLVEPNSVLGQSIRYLLKHWEKLTLFLRQAGAPLDNNICERALKKAIRHRKNSLFYLTQNGADTGDLFMSLIHTCELCGANPFDYMNQLQRHGQELASHPADWMPWNYRQTLEPATATGEATG